MPPLPSALTVAQDNTSTRTSFALATPAATQVDDVVELLPKLLRSATRGGFETARREGLCWVMNFSYNMLDERERRREKRGNKRTGVVRNELLAAAAAFRAALSVVTCVTSGLLDVSNPVGQRLQELLNSAVVTGMKEAGVRFSTSRLRTPREPLLLSLIKYRNSILYKGPCHGVFNELNPVIMLYFNKRCLSIAHRDILSDRLEPRIVMILQERTDYGWRRV